MACPARRGPTGFAISSGRSTAIPAHRIARLNDRTALLQPIDHLQHLRRRIRARIFDQDMKLQHTGSAQQPLQISRIIERALHLRILSVCLLKLINGFQADGKIGGGFLQLLDLGLPRLIGQLERRLQRAGGEIRLLDLGRAAASYAISRSACAAASFFALAA